MAGGVPLAQIVPYDRVPYALASVAKNASHASASLTRTRDLDISVKIQRPEIWSKNHAAGVRLAQNNLRVRVPDANASLAQPPSHADAFTCFMRPRHPSFTQPTRLRRPRIRVNPISPQLTRTLTCRVPKPQPPSPYPSTTLSPQSPPAPTNNHPQPPRPPPHHHHLDPTVTPTPPLSFFFFPSSPSLSPSFATALTAANLGPPQPTSAGHHPNSHPLFSTIPPNLPPFNPYCNPATAPAPPPCRRRSPSAAASAPLCPHPCSISWRFTHQVPPFCDFSPRFSSSMSDSQGRRKGKVTTGKRKRGESSVSILGILHDDSWREKNFTPQEKADQLVPAADLVKFANKYLQLRGKQVLVTEEAIEDILQLPPKSDQPDGYQKAEEDMRFMRFDWDAVKRDITLDLTVPWVMGKSTVVPKGIRLIYLNDEARLWQQILSNYVMPSTHETEVPAAMITLIWCVMTGKDLYLPCFIWHYMTRVHVPWEVADEKPPATDCRKIIPHSRKFQALGYRPPFLTDSAETATSSIALSAFTGPAPPTAPPPAPEPVYLLVHRLFDCLDQMERRHQQHFERSERRNRQRYERSEHRHKRRYEHLKLMIRSGGDIPSDTSEEEVSDHEEEAPTQAEQRGPEHTVPYLEEHHQLQATNPDIPIQIEPLLQQTAPPTLIETADPQPTTETPATHPSRYDTSSHPV
ncbi:uncharacterized protein DS421_7g217570 [Arachis hypogaea]|nr:uncharacterized protein DS421_7g217570 [Arachis hypogaea]